MGLLLGADDQGGGRPDRRGRLSTVGHRQAFRAFLRAAKQAGMPYCRCERECAVTAQLSLARVHDRERRGLEGGAS